MTTFVEERKTTTGKTYYAFNPKKYVRDAIDVGYKTFPTKEAAVDYAKKVIERYEAYKANREKIHRIEEDTVDGLIAFYRTTNEWRKLTDNSRIAYTLMIRTASEFRLENSSILFGKMLSRNVTPTHSDKLYDQIGKQFSAHRSTHVIKVLRKVWNVGKRHGKVDFNPFEKMGIAGLKPRLVLWEPEQVEAFVRKADAMGFWSIGTILMLCYDLCQRPGDMRQLRWSDFDGESFKFIQEKTKQSMDVPASERLVERLRSFSGTTPANDAIICLHEPSGKPYDRFLYAKVGRRIRAAAGLPSELQIRDLRRTGATEMAEAGCTEDELRAVTGHKSRDVLSTYVRPTKKLAASGINRRFAK
jgi:integrase